MNMRRTDEPYYPNQGIQENKSNVIGKEYSLKDLKNLKLNNTLQCCVKTGQRS